MPIVERHSDGAVVAVKVVPGASRESIVGPLGERLKVTVSKPPSKGAANEAVCALLAAALGVRASEVEILRGGTRPEKELLVRGVGPEEVRRHLGVA